MKTARFHAFALLISFSLLGTLGFACVAAAQCIPDPPTGSIVTHPCNLAALQAIGPETIVASVPLSVFVSNPLVATVTWMSGRSGSHASARDAALRSNRYAEATVRRGRTLRQGAW